MDIWLRSQSESQSAVALEAPEAPVSEIHAGSTNNIRSKEVTILYGSQTGNAQGLAEKAGKTLEGHGFQVTFFHE